jgi:hypothetical protein
MAVTKRSIPWFSQDQLTMLQHGLDNFEPNNRKINKAWNKAMEQLPIERRHPFDPTMQSAWRKAVLAQRAGIGPPTPPGYLQLIQVPVPKKDTPITITRKTERSEAVAVDPKPELETPRPKAGQASNTLTEIVQQLVLKALELPALRAAIVNIVDTHYQGQLAPDAPARERANPLKLVARHKLPRALIVGLKGHQPMEITHTLGDKFNLTFWNTERALNELRDKAVRCEVSFVHTDHVSHSATMIAQARSPTCFLVGGGVKSMKDAMLKWHKERQNGNGS